MAYQNAGRRRCGLKRGSTSLLSSRMHAVFYFKFYIIIFFHKTVTILWLNSTITSLFYLAWNMTHHTSLRLKNVKWSDSPLLMYSEPHAMYVYQSVSPRINVSLCCTIYLTHDNRFVCRNCVSHSPTLHTPQYWFPTLRSSDDPFIGLRLARQWLWLCH